MCLVCVRLCVYMRMSLYISLYYPHCVVHRWCCPWNRIHFGRSDFFSFFLVSHAHDRTHARTHTIYVHTYLWHRDEPAPRKRKRKNGKKKKKNDKYATTSREESGRAHPNTNTFIFIYRQTNDEQTSVVYAFEHDQKRLHLRTSENKNYINSMMVQVICCLLHGSIFFVVIFHVRNGTIVDATDSLFAFSALWSYAYAFYYFMLFNLTFFFSLSFLLFFYFTFYVGAAIVQRWHSSFVSKRNGVTL